MKSSIEGRIAVIQPCDVERAFVLETEGYPEDEAASFDSLKFRQKEAPELFIGYYEGSKLYGFICGTRSMGSHLSHESMSHHLPTGEIVCIHSVCVDKKKRRQGLASQMLQHYIQHVQKTQIGVSRILLICRATLIPLYSRAGFTYVAKSKVEHGKLPWHEMELILCHVFRSTSPVRRSTPSVRRPTSPVRKLNFAS